MSRKEFLSSPGSTFAPIVILLTDGEPTDNYKQGLEVLWGNNWSKTPLSWLFPSAAASARTDAMCCPSLQATPRRC